MYSKGIESALRAAIAAHDGQSRKGGDDVPYVTHPIHACLMLARFGADEETIQAAVLHDVVEDCEDWTIERVELEFGARVAAIVDDLTEDKSMSWEERKSWATAHVPDMTSEGVLVKAADKLHNLSSLLESLRWAEDRSTVWAKFRGGRERTLAHSTELVEALVQRLDEKLAEPLRETLAAIQALE